MGGQRTGVCEVTSREVMVGRVNACPEGMEYLKIRLIRFMKTISATEASRHFSELLDRVRHDRESFVIIRRGEAVAKPSQ